MEEEPVMKEFVGLRKQILKIRTIVKDPPLLVSKQNTKLLQKGNLNFLQVSQRCFLTPVTIQIVMLVMLLPLLAMIIRAAGYKDAVPVHQSPLSVPLFHSTHQQNLRARACLPRQVLKCLLLRLCCRCIGLQ